MGRESKPGIGKIKGIALSYVLPTHNRAEYLGECLLSLFEQDFPQENFEIIVVDDGSTDTTQELMEFLVKDHPNLRYFKRGKSSVEEARNFGNQKARANIIGVCDSDDLYHPDRTKITVEYFKSHPGIDIMNGSYIEINHVGLAINKHIAIPLDIKEFLAGHQAYFCHDNAAYKKNRILKTPYRKKGEQTDDWKLVHDFLEAGYKFGFVEDELCGVRTLKNGIMGARRERIGLKLEHID